MLKRNLIANYLGQGWTALMGLAFIPLYIKYLGIEAYGLIGLFGVLQAWLALLDMGMTPVLNREMARFTACTHTAATIRDLLRSIEIIALVIALLLGFGIWAGSGWLARDWLRAEKMPTEIVAQAFAIMGAVTALRFVEGIYRSAIIGLQRQVAYNVVNSLLATLRGLGAVGVLIWIEPTIEAFFLWQGLVSILSLGVLAALTYRSIPKAERGGQFSITELRSVWRFAWGMIGITFSSLLLMQIDKIILSKLLVLSDFGYYTLASVVAGSLFMMVGPIGQAWYPKLTELQETNQHSQLIEKFHQGAQLVSVVKGSVSIIMIVFAEPILFLWSNDPILAHRSAYLLSLLALGNLLNGLMHIPYFMQLAHGWTSLSARVNFLSVVVITPAMLWTAPRYGPEGAAWLWVLLNASYFLISVNFMFSRIIKTERWHWYINDNLLPISGAVAGVMLCKWLFIDSDDSLLQILMLVLALLTSITFATLLSKEVSAIVKAFLTTHISHFKYT